MTQSKDLATSPFDIHHNEVPAIRIADAVGRGINKNILFRVGGGLGDRICAEPTLRYALENFKGCEFSLSTDTPELFLHLLPQMKEIYKDEPPVGKYLQLPTYAVGLANQFYNANLMHGVDFASISALRCQLPNQCKVPKLEPTAPSKDVLLNIAHSARYVLLHVGKSWASRTFPSSFWNEIIWRIHLLERIPVLIGLDSSGDLDPINVCLDLRNKLTLNNYLWTVKHCDSVITNDSSPLHIAATGSGKIAYIPTIRHPDLLTHWRYTSGRPVFGWRMASFYRKPMWELNNICPNTLEANLISEMPPGHSMDEFLPEVSSIIDWIQKS